MRVGIVEISEKMILNWLKLEEGKILNASFQTNRIGRLDLMISHPEFPTVEEGLAPTYYSPSYTSHFCGHICDLGEHTITTREIR